MMKVEPNVKVVENIESSIEQKIAGSDRNSKKAKGVNQGSHAIPEIFHHLLTAKLDSYRKKLGM